MPRISDAFRKCVVFAGWTDANRSLHVGATAFIVSIQLSMPDLGSRRPPMGRFQAVYFVTARHVIDGIRSKSAAAVSLRMNLRHSPTYECVEVPLDAWCVHEDESVDVAVAEVQESDEFAQKFDYLTLPVNDFFLGKPSSNFSVGIGDEIYITSLLKSHSETNKNIPIVRVGNISAMPEERIKTEFSETKGIDAYLVEARSIRGMSGAPVFVRPTNAMGDTFLYLLGLMHGHFGTKKNSLDDSVGLDVSDEYKQWNVGIGIVVPSHYITDVLNYKPFVDSRHSLENELANRVSTKTDW